MSEIALHRADLSPEIIKRFWGRVDVRGFDECWPWTGVKFQTGYGAFYFKGANRTASRMVCLLVWGDLDGSTFALHDCDNPNCCNPFHIRPGSHEDNMLDKIKRNRCATGERHGSKTRPDRVARGDRNGSRIHLDKMPRGDAHYAKRHPEKLSRGDAHYARVSPEKVSRGEGHYNSKFTWEDVHLIRDLWQKRTMTQVDLAKKFGVRQATISAIVNNLSWKTI